MLLSAVIPMICFCAAFGADAVLGKKFAGDKKIAETAGKFRKKLVGAVCVLICVFILLCAVASANMINGESGLSAAAVTAVSLLTSSAMTADRYAGEITSKLLK